MSLRGTGQGGTLARLWETVEVLGSAGMLNPSFTFNLGKGIKKWGSTPAGGFWASAQRRPDDVGLIDEAGPPMTFREIDQHSNAIANGLAAAGVKTGDGVSLFARNHRGFVLSMVALNKLGADTLLLNTGFAAPQLAEVVAREGSQVVLYDEEFAPIVERGAPDKKRFVTYGNGPLGDPTIFDLAGRSSNAEPAAPSRHGRTTILTSGTTGTPKGAQRSVKSASLDTLIGLLGRLPLCVGCKSFDAAPAFHSWGGIHLLFGALLSNTILMRNRFDPEDTLRTIHEHTPDVLAVVPVMMQRILALPPEVIRKYDCRSLKIVAASGSALPGELALRWMDTFGDNVYNFYGSTEVAQASIAMPDELRAVPGTAGRPPRGTIVRIIDADGKEVPAGVTGRIFVGNDNQFEGYTGGGNKEIIQGLMSSGDVGHFDQNGLLFVDGRDDDMIISGGENVFPREVEDLLADHPMVHEAAVIGVADTEFGQRLQAFVVLVEARACSADDLKKHVRDHLARYKVPRDIVFLEELPRNPTGKVLKRVLKEMVIEVRQEG
ncbi:MAG: AMP-binding protein [Deltaproteobacteria bacterium]|nr:AMP-binding protein [Deltaproteobacteria bacterium]